MKKDPLIYFPNSADNTNEKTAKVGQLLAIGAPSKKYYEYINQSLNYNSLAINDFKILLKLEGVHVKIISIMNMKNGNLIAVVRKKDGSNFLNNIEKLFTDLNKAIASKELTVI